MRRASKLAIAAAVALAAAYFGVTRINLNPGGTVGEIVDSLDGVAVYYNGAVRHTEGLNLAPDGYNLGIKYQCVEFVKRYYYERYRHRMPDSYGHAADFFVPAVADGALSPARGLLQFPYGGGSAPQAGDILVFDRWLLNPYGHVAIVSRAGEGEVEIVQQNGGPLAPSRETLGLAFAGERWTVAAPRVLGWLRFPDKAGAP